jgi:hypothetical protein
MVLLLPSNLFNPQKLYSSMWRKGKQKCLVILVENVHYTVNPGTVSAVFIPCGSESVSLDSEWHI